MRQWEEHNLKTKRVIPWEKEHNFQSSFFDFGLSLHFINNGYVIDIIFGRNSKGNFNGLMVREIMYPSFLDEAVQTYNTREYVVVLRD